MGHSFDRVQTVSEKNWHNHERGFLRVVSGSAHHQSDKIRLCGSIGSFYKRNAGWLHSGGGGHRWPELSLQGSRLLLDRIFTYWLFIICNNISRSSSNCNSNRDSNGSGSGGCNNYCRSYDNRRPNNSNNSHNSIYNNSWTNRLRSFSLNYPVFWFWSNFQDT